MLIPTIIIAVIAFAFGLLIGCLCRISAFNDQAEEIERLKRCRRLQDKAILRLCGEIGKLRCGKPTVVKTSYAQREGRHKS